MMNNWWISPHTTIQQMYDSLLTVVRKKQLHWKAEVFFQVRLNCFFSSRDKLTESLQLLSHPVEMEQPTSNYEATCYTTNVQYPFRLGTEVANFMPNTQLSQATIEDSPVTDTHNDGNYMFCLLNQQLQYLGIDTMDTTTESNPLLYNPSGCDYYRSHLPITQPFWDSVLNDSKKAVSVAVKQKVTNTILETLEVSQQFLTVL